MANVALSPRVDGQILHGRAEEQQVAAPQLNRYVQLDPNEECQRHEWQQTAWNVAGFVSLVFSMIFIGTIAGIGAFAAVSAAALLTPEFAPAALVLVAALIVAIIGFKIFNSLYEIATAKAGACGWQAMIERGVAAQLENLPAGPNPIVIQQINRAVPQEHRFIAARYLYWKNQVAQLQDVVQQGLRAAQLEHLPQNPHERRERLHAVRLDTFRLITEQLLPAKVQTAFWYGILRRPDFRMEFEEQVVFHLPAPSADHEERARSAQERLANIGLAHSINVVPDDPFLTITRGMWQGEEARIHLTLAQVQQMNEAQLSMMVVPVA